MKLQNLYRFLYRTNRIRVRIQIWDGQAQDQDLDPAKTINIGLDPDSQHFAEGIEPAN
jgi:hypothetical protein